MNNIFEITDIVESKKNQFKIYINEKYAFSLYKSEIKTYKLKVGDVLDSGKIDNIKDETVYKRARERALYIIERGEKTEYQIRKKLKDNGYTQDIIDRVVDMLIKYSFINDYEYAKKYIGYKISSKSIRVIKQDLLLKGISKDIIEEALLDIEPDESDALESVYLKKYIKYDLSDYNEKSKVIRGLMNKGFSYDDISSLLDKYSN